MPSLKDFFACCCVAVALLVVPGCVRAETPAQSADEAALRAQANDYVKAFAAGNARAVADMWTEDGTYALPSGEEYRGRAAIEKFFASGFKSGGAQPLAINIESLRFPSPSNDIAIEEGSCRILQGQAAGASSHYMVVHVKQKDGKWLMAAVTESDMSPPGGDSLKELNWLVGNWTAKGPKGTLHFHADWAADHNFIHCVYGQAAAADQESIQLIGWNPRSHAIASWHFSTGGGHGYGTWHKDGDSWVESAIGVEPDGATSSCSYLVHRVNDDTFTWRSAGRMVGGTRIPDTQEITVTRDSK